MPVAKFDNGGQDENKPSSSSKTAENGYFRTFALGVASVAVYLCALLAASVMCVACIAGSCLLWARGLYSVAEWTAWRLSDKGRSGSGETTNRGYPTAMPGQEHGNNWRHAWKHVAKAQNFRVRHEHDSEHFHVAPLLQSMSGLDMERLCFLTMKKRNNPSGAASSSGEDGAGEQLGEPDEPDPEAAGGYMFPVEVKTNLSGCNGRRIACPKHVHRMYDAYCTAVGATLRFFRVKMSSSEAITCYVAGKITKSNWELESSLNDTFAGVRSMNFDSCMRPHALRFLPVDAVCSPIRSFH